MKKMMSSDDSAALFMRIVVGLVFLTEGIQKFLFPELFGPGRFIKIGFSHAEFWAYVTACFEITCGVLVLLGLLTKVASIPLLIIMITAFVTTKWPMLMNKGFWTFAHEYRTDFAMTVLSIYLIIHGGGKYSFDAVFRKKK
jgi:uncharacterized membrane protein YphA (DoxX/SURF4 family)